MRRMRGGIRTIVVTVAVLALVGAGCAADEEQRIAQDACDLMRQIVDDGPAAFDEDMIEEFEDLQARAEEADISDAEMEATIQEECPDVFEDLETLGSD